MKTKKIQWCFILGTLIGAATFFYLYGAAILNPVYDDWIMMTESEIVQHYLGWKAYRAATWSFPIGLFDGLSYPVKASIIFFDSIPLFAVLFKVLSPVLPETFQYFGIWGLLCYCLQGGISAKILEKYLKSVPAVVLGTVFFLSSTVVYTRMFAHTALASHWIILLALLLVAYEEEYFRDWKRALIAWGAVSILCVTVHLYFLPMCGIILLGFLAKDFLREKNWKRVFSALAVFMVCAVAVTALLGGFAGASAPGNGLGLYSFNLNSFYNSRGRGRLLPALPYVTDSQLEGYDYLGAGVLALIPISAALWLFDHRSQLRERVFWKSSAVKALPWLIIIVLSIATALSPVVTWNEHTLFTLPLPGRLIRLWSTFRASGRLAWAAGYVLMLFAICAGLRSRKPVQVYVCLAACVLIQIVDVGPFFHSLRKDRSGMVYESPLDSPVLAEIAADGRVKHLVIREIYSMSNRTMYRLGDYALANGMDQNYFHYAHALGTVSYTSMLDLMNDLRDDAMYVFEHDRALRCGQYDLHYYEANGHIIGLTWQLEQAKELDAEDLGAARWGFSDGRSLSGGEDIDGVRHIYPGGVSFGPYMRIPDGIWQIDITGENLKAGTYACTFNNGTHSAEIIGMEITDTKAILTVKLEADVDEFEVVILNNSGEEILLTEILIRGATPDDK